jgi:hypothetical protein
MLGILYHETKIEANSRNSALNHSAEQKTLGIPFRNVPQRKNARNSVPWKKIEANVRNSVPKHVSDKNMLSILFFSNPSRDLSTPPLYPLALGRIYEGAIGQQR